jgi:hypothetical protein
MVKGEGKEKEIGKGMGKGVGEVKGNSPCCRVQRLFLQVTETFPQGSWPLGLPSLVDTLC